MEMPEGYDTVVGERGVTLSGGQRQRISIARTAVRDAPILIPDEPTTGLDGENARLVSEALVRLAEGRTTFLITHDLRQVSTADQILYVEEGDVVERGTHAQLLDAGGRYTRLQLVDADDQPDGRRPGPDRTGLRGLGQGLRQQRDERLELHVGRGRDLLVRAVERLRRQPRLAVDQLGDLGVDGLRRDDAPQTGSA